MNVIRSCESTTVYVIGTLTSSFSATSSSITRLDLVQVHHATSDQGRSVGINVVCVCRRLCVYDVICVCPELYVYVCM
jgi:hypothetical protein